MSAVDFSSSDVSDACDELALGVARTGALRPVWSPAPPVAGPLRTVRLEPADGVSPLEELRRLFADAGPVVWLLDLEGRADYQCFGSVLAAAALDAGAPGVLVNGAVRDVDELLALAFPTYARGVFPAAMRGRLRIAAVDEPVAIDDVIVARRSYVVADTSGLVAFAAAHADDVLRVARELRSREQP
jgi:4-hydroxy-4-methyl-2-oxoglutarate aldolase